MKKLLMLVLALCLAAAMAVCALAEEDMSDVVKHEETDNVQYTPVDAQNHTMTYDLIYVYTHASKGEVSRENAGQKTETEAHEFENGACKWCGYKQAEASETPVPSSGSVSYSFAFTVRWDAQPLDSVDWVLYNPDGTAAHKRFNRRIVSENEWRYEAWFSVGADYYIVENVPEGYRAVYENVGEHAGETDRCYNGGTITHYAVPNTDEETNLPVWDYVVPATATPAPARNNNGGNARAAAPAVPQETPREEPKTRVMSALGAINDFMAVLSANTGDAVIPELEQVLTENETKVLRSLPIQDQAMLLLSILGEDELVEANAEALSPAAAALRAVLAERLAAMSEEERAAFLEMLAERFPIETRRKNGQEIKVIVLTVAVEKDGQKVEERTFEVPLKL